MIKLAVNNEGNVEVVEFFETVEATVDYLKRTDLVSWQKDEDPEANDLDLTNVETLQQLEAALEEVKLSWWEIEVEEIDSYKINSIEELTYYLENYPNSRSNLIDTVFSLFKSDVSKIAENYRKGEAYIYSKEDFLEEKKEIAEKYKQYLINEGFTLEEILEEDKNYQDYSNIVEEVTRSKARFFIEEVGVTGFSEIL